MNIVDDPTIVHLFKRLQISLDMGIIDKIAFCTTDEKEDNPLVELIKPLMWIFTEEKLKMF